MDDHHELADMLRDVRRIVRKALEGTSLRGHVAQFGSVVGGGKMLRARSILRIGPVVGVAPAILCRAAAAAEMLHAASLLHDDILDGGTLRRGNPSVWVSDGVKAAVILGDLLVSLAVEGIHEALPARLPMLVATLREMCEAEADQEFIGRGVSQSWERCVAIARRKTGSLFGFAAACAGGSDPERVAALRRAGYALGTAYQLADDLLDACPVPWASDKSLGTDATTGKLTAANVSPQDGTDPQAVIDALLHESKAELAPWPDVQDAWRAYVDDAVAPLVAQCVGAARQEAMA